MLHASLAAAQKRAEAEEAARRMAEQVAAAAEQVAAAAIAEMSGVHHHHAYRNYFKGIVDLGLFKGILLLVCCRLLHHYVTPAATTTTPATPATKWPLPPALLVARNVYSLMMMLLRSGPEEGQGIGPATSSAATS
jgi:hypothetical protein